MVVPVVALVWARGSRGGLGLPRVPLFIGLVVAVVGLVIRAYVVGTAAPGTSGRNTREQIADHLNTTGLYSLVRHPVYLGNLLVWLGIAITTGVWWAVAGTGLSFLAFYRSIMVTEERFLEARFGDRYLEWSSRTPALVPAFTRWTPPALPFALTIALRQEYYGWFTVTLMLLALELVARFANSGRASLGPEWLVALIVVTVASATLRFLQRKTTLLDVPGR